MTTKGKNMLLYMILSNHLELKEAISNKKNYFSLNLWELNALRAIAEISNIKPRTGWSIARTIYYRAIEGRPF